MKVRDLIEALEKLDGDVQILTGKYDARCGRWTELRSVEPDIAPTIFVEPKSEYTFRDVTDTERDRDQLAVIL